MVDYDDPIRPEDFKYNKPIYFQNPGGEIRYDLIVKLVLDNDNFNFDLAEDTGNDFRLVMYGGTLKMWKAFWSKSFRRAVLFFIIPSTAAIETIRFQAFWGNDMAPNISKPEDFNFLFYENFDNLPLDSSKWSVPITLSITTYGYTLDYWNSYAITTTTNPLEGQTSFRVECGVYALWDSTAGSAGVSAVGFNFTGTENNFFVGFCKNTQAYTTGVDGSITYSTSNNGGMEALSYQELTVSYYEPEDLISAKLSERTNYEDAEHSWHRKVEGDTRPKNLTVGGRSAISSSYGPGPSYISWLVIRSDAKDEIGVLDGSTLFIEYEYVAHQVVDYREYSADVTSVMYNHETSWGGNPYLLSDNNYDADSNIWISNPEAIAQDYVALTINMGWAEDVTDVKYTHYDSGHVLHYNASRLSDNDASLYGWTYMKLTTTSGWSAIKFSSTRIIGAFRMKSTSNLEAAPKDFKFYGSNYNPVIDYSKATLLVTGTFEKTTEWQSRVLTNGNKYRYYILEVENTYGNENIEIQEWEMMDSLGQRDKIIPTQLRLHPALYGELSYNFPKEISLVASNDGINWSTLIPWQSTYTPFIIHNVAYGYWQRYSFNNEDGFWSFRLLCRGNWLAEDDTIAIGEWSIHELESEEYTYHILAGTSNNVKQIWAQDNCTLDDAHVLFFTANDYVSRLSDNRLVGSEELPLNYSDINVVQESY